MSTKVLITSAGTGSAVSAIKCLKMQRVLPVKVLASDTDATAPGLHLADKSFCSPPISSNDYLSFLENLAVQEGPYCLIPTYSGEIELIAAHQNELRHAGILTYLPSPQSVRKCNDKLRFGELATKLGFKTPRVLSVDEVEHYPVFLKPRSGSGSRAARRIDSEHMLMDAMAAVKEPIIQEFIAGPEVTVDVICNSSGTLQGLCARERTAIKGGQSVKGRTMDSTPFEHAIQAVCEALELRGCSNFQFIQSAGGLVLLEVNPRLAAGGLMLTTMAGINIPLLLVQSMLGHAAPQELLRAPTGLFMAKYWSEVFWQEDAALKTHANPSRQTNAAMDLLT